MYDLDKLLNELNNWLYENNNTIELIVIGAYAIQLHGINFRSTMDIDTLIEISNIEIQEKIDEIGQKYGIPSWLNNQAQGLIIPDGFFDRSLESNKFSAIKIRYASRIDLILLKIAAYFYRHEFELKDLDDLRALKINIAEFNEGAKFLKEKHRPETIKFQKKFNEEVEHILKDLKGKIFG